MARLNGESTASGGRRAREPSSGRALELRRAWVDRTIVLAARGRCHFRIVTEREPSEVVGSLGAGFTDSRCLHVAVNLDLADVVADDPRERADVARVVGAGAGALARVVRHLVSLGVFEFRAGQTWHNAASRGLTLSGGGVGAAGQPRACRPPRSRVRQPPRPDLASASRSRTPASGGRRD